VPLSAGTHFPISTVPDSPGERERKGHFIRGRKDSHYGEKFPALVTAKEEAVVHKSRGRSPGPRLTEVLNKLVGGPPA